MQTFQPTQTTLALLYFAYSLAKMVGWFGVAVLAAVGVALIPALLAGPLDQDLTSRASLEVVDQISQHGPLLVGSIAGIWFLRFVAARLIRAAEASIDV